MTAQQSKNKKVESPDQKIWVAFTGQTDIPWLRWLKPGFRHCFVVINDGSHWVSLDPMANRFEVTVHDVPADFDFPHWLRTCGLTIIESRAQNRNRSAPLMPLTCVEAVKRILGIHDRFILTPWQLYCRLQEQNGANEPSRPRSIFALAETLEPLMEKGTISWEV
ncbi:MAG: hypothetical protein H6858_01945 [Rhodospirillales bacterium]|nr:hypothetical protein [Alphaproteobacteria bacterium]MCB1840598.1 hypothetical protein [Alphaproteobacteria bacterium]MCB9976346.1 hypothetical protein [Rhodospirillales bacterium]